jgi:hypothetical protein
MHFEFGSEGTVSSIEVSSGPQNHRVPIVLTASKSAGAKGDVPKIYGFVHSLLLWERETQVTTHFSIGSFTRSKIQVSTYLLDVLWGQPIKLIQLVFTSKFHEY